MKKIPTGSNENIINSDDAESEEQMLSMFDDILLKLFEYESEKSLHTLNPPPEGYLYHWFVNAKTRMMENFSSGIQIEVIEEYDDDNYLCYTNGKEIVVNKSLLKKQVEQ